MPGLLYCKCVEKATRAPGDYMRTSANTPQAGVYVFKRGKERLYVGSTNNLQMRPNKRDKRHGNRWSAILEADHTELIPCASLLKAKQLEEQLIRAYHPVYNLRNPRAEADWERTANIIWENW